MRGSHLRDCGIGRRLGIIPAHAGSRAVPAGRHEPGGIIPAHAGLTKVSSHSNILSGDHPRACGAHAWQDQLNAIKQGSSPRMRGSHIVRYRIRTRVGIIPAHAGLTDSPCDRSKERWDHPRACGAHGVSILYKDRAAGSSPRMRGSLVVVDVRICDIGIIPAHAGLTRDSGR